MDHNYYFPEVLLPEKSGYEPRLLRNKGKMVYQDPPGHIWRSIPGPYCSGLRLLLSLPSEVHRSRDMSGFYRNSFHREPYPLNAVPKYLHFRYRPWGASRYYWVLQNGNRNRQNVDQEWAVERIDLTRFPDWYSPSAIFQFGQFCILSVANRQEGSIDLVQ